jgi:hypothetical protein
MLRWRGFKGCHLKDFFEKIDVLVFRRAGGIWVGDCGVWAGPCSFRGSESDLLFEGHQPIERRSVYKQKK